ncbi:SusD family protein [Filimonas lacunae]|uniref:SusD family protein n=1 Tax=Filimonas lacunae TaxID=477680 RepID=A0A173MJG2_9BACT|nr:RagB/SusD family nutrient uptake outer membrane protein [Filimonas lacunae]BAV07551.1 hypothetical protein FLA_3577 [Filimonas lacunae]SIT29981.1 SusD family protein [Filimonas lacunae]
MKLNIYKYAFTALTGSALLMGATSCKKYVTLDTPPDALETNVVFTDSATATSAIVNMYSRMAASNQTGTLANTCGWGVTTYGAMSADEGYYYGSGNFTDYQTNTLAAGNTANVLWSGLYQRIARANGAIVALPDAPLSTTLKSQLLGEAKFVRAWMYFYLVSYYGGVPLYLNTDAITGSLLPRSAAADVYTLILQDLTDAKALLNTNYPSTERARANKYVVSAMLARVYFYMGKWAEAEAEATTVISSGTYSLVQDLSTVFLNNSNETIWQISLASTTTPQTIFGSEYLPTGTTPKFVLYDTLVNAFETGDQRKTNWVASLSNANGTFYYPYKYKVAATTTGKEYPIMLRLGEQYLIRAEARANQDNVTGAKEDVDVVRNRAGLTGTTAQTKAEVLAALTHERWVELFMESGDRWLNLKRLNQASVLKGLKPSWKDFQVLYPIPLSSRSANINLLDNDGYK